MAIINRKQLKKRKQEGQITEQEFLSKAEDYQADIIPPDLQGLSLDDLAIQYAEIDQQSNLLKGNILLEARSRFPSDKEFGQWISTHSLCVGSQQSRNRLMHLADFFCDGRDMEGITITAAYEISAPVNRDKAMTVYHEVRGKNLSVKEVKGLLAEDSVKRIKKINSKVEEIKNIDDDEVNRMAIDLIDKIMVGKTKSFKLDALKKAISYLEEKR
ncbi:MAG: hypothetical protein V3U87_09100 [Methylococcaceae bacterium]